MLPSQFFSPSKRKCSALLKFSSLSVVPSQRRRSPSQLYQLLTYATVGNNEFFFFSSCCSLQHYCAVGQASSKMFCPKHFFFFTLALSYLSIWLKSDFRSHLDPPPFLALLLKGPLRGHFLSPKWNLSPVLVLATQADEHRFKNVRKKQETEQSVTCSLQFLPAL